MDKEFASVIRTIFFFFLVTANAEDLESIKNKADQGFVEAQYSLGFLYKHGQGVRQSYEEAAKWYRKAADQRHAVAQKALDELNK
ncbi:MAG: SEL1-like repeat protein [Thermodesulfobacteriota bacterium]